MGSATIPTGYTVRPAAWDDLGDVARMLRTIDIHDTGHPDMGESELASDWRHPGLVLATDTWLVFDADGNLTAYAWLLPRDGHVRLNGWGAVHPDHRGRGIGTLLLDLSEGRAVEHRAEAPPERDVEIEIGTMAPDHDVRAMLETRGFRSVRQFWRMEIALEPGMTAGPHLDGVAIRSFVRRTDDRAVHAVLTESFEGQWGFVARPFDEWAAHRLDDPDHDPSVWFVANEGDELVGALVGATGRDGVGWVHTLGVRKAWRGRGVAASLLRHAFVAFSGKGMHAAALGVDSEYETGATRLYSRVGMHVTHHYNSYVKILPGRAS